MKLTQILGLINIKLAGETLTYNQAQPYLDACVCDINTHLNACFPMFSTVHPTLTQDANYEAIPDTYIVSVIVPGVAFKFYTTDEEGISTAAGYQQEYERGLFYMVRDYSASVPEQYKAENRGYVEGPAPSFVRDPLCIKGLPTVNPDLRYIEGRPGPPGPPGPPGYTPKKGIDYYTPDDIAALGLPKYIGMRTTLASYGITDAYTKTETDKELETLKEQYVNLVKAFEDKSDKHTTLAGYGIIDAYTKQATDTKLNKKADKGTTLAEYGIEDAVKLIVTEQHTGVTIYTLFNNYTTPGVYVFVDQVASMKQTYILFVTKNRAVYGGAIRDLFEQQLLSWNGVVERRKFYFNEGELVVVEKWKSYTSYTKTESDAKHEDLQSQIHQALDTANSAYSLASDTANIEMDKKADKTIIEYFGASDGDLSLGYLYNKEARFVGIAPDKLNFIIKDGVYEEDYIAGVSFITNPIPPEVSYTNTGIVHWVGCDCSYADGYSLFIPSGSMNYDIVFYFNGYKFIGLVNGYKTATGNAVSQQ